MLAPTDHMQRVMVIGPCGSGKSTLARRLNERLNLPLIHIDQLHWQRGWQEGSIADLRASLASLCAREHWIIDGNYGRSLDIRLARADTVVYLDFPIRLCLWRLVKRLIRYRGRTRPDMPDGCPERFDFDFLLYMAKWNSGPRERTERQLEGHEDKIVRLKTPKQLARWLASVETGQP